VEPGVNSHAVLITPLVGSKNTLPTISRALFRGAKL